MHTVVVGLGGSACTDGGAGLLQGLGIRLRDTAGAELVPGGAALRDLCTLDLAGSHPGLATAELVLACDVDNPLLGPDGAAAIYGPQKGANPDQVAALEVGLARWASVVSEALGDAVDPATAGAGAAGGTGFAAFAVLGARLRPGIEVLLGMLGIDDRVARADLVITGEGALDAQTLRGKGPAGVAVAAARHGRPTVAVAGRIELGVSELARAGFTGGYALADLEPDPQRCISDAARLLEDVGARLIMDWLRGETVRATARPSIRPVDARR
ncbi:glycerate kinase [Pseudonocardia sp. GCM10023141]|uniref:glycerate kinase n=1 Tax=Pseudonocardia sp. GCM10023141 TaxID=3252653 RepID=UPI00361FB358